MTTVGLTNIAVAQGKDDHLVMCGPAVLNIVFVCLCVSQPAQRAPFHRLKAPRRAAPATMALLAAALTSPPTAMPLR